MMTIEQIAGIANEVAAELATSYTLRSGTVCASLVKVSLVDGELNLSADCNAYVSEKRASAELNAVWSALRARLDSETLAAHRSVSVRGYKVWRYGFWNMGRFCTSGMRRGMKARTVVALESV